MSEVGIVIPCYNEAERLDFACVAELLQEPRVKIYLVDDGSTDSTFDLLTRFASAHPERVEVMPMLLNEGKAEAVRRGLLRALEEGARFVGYLDADMATPPSEMLRLLSVLEDTHALFVLGSRIRMLGVDIQRNSVRHYSGRVFATLASLLLGLPVYDTQCGAKFAKDHSTLRHALALPFMSRWSFDVELLSRLISNPASPYGVGDFVEIPLGVWHERGGSKVSSVAMIRAGIDLLRLGVSRRRWRR